MSLWFTLRINRKEIGSLVIRRIDPYDLQPEPGTIGTYVVVRDGQELGKVEHRYGDGAWVLVRKALELGQP